MTPEPCLNCGALMAHVALGPDTAPWLCQPCGRGFWQAECSPQARKRYRPEHHDWGYGALWLADQVVAEHAAAVERGTSAVPGLLHLVPESNLRLLAGRTKIPESFRAEIVHHLEGRR